MTDNAHLMWDDEDDPLAAPRASTLMLDLVLTGQVTAQASGVGSMSSANSYPKFGGIGVYDVRLDKSVQATAANPHPAVQVDSANPPNQSRVASYEGDLAELGQDEDQEEYFFDTQFGVGGELNAYGKPPFGSATSTADPTVTLKLKLE